MLPTSPTNHGRTSTTREQGLLGTAVDEPNLGQKPKLGGVRALLPFSLYLPLVRFYLFEVFACSSFFF